MLQSIKELYGFGLNALNGGIGRVKDLYFDDQEWQARYLVVDTGKWLPGRRVLIPASELRIENEDGPVIEAILTKEQVAESPDIHHELPVSKQSEIELMRYYGWIRYQGPIGDPESGVGKISPRGSERKAEKEVAEWDPHLRSVREVSGYQIQAKEDKFGMVEDLILESEDWLIRYLVLDTTRWLPGRLTLISSAWVDQVDGVEKTIRFDLEPEIIKNSPTLEPSSPITFEYESRIYDHYLQGQ